MINCRHLPCLHSLNHHHEVNYLVMKFLGLTLENRIQNNSSLCFQNEQSGMFVRLDLIFKISFIITYQNNSNFLGKSYKTNTLLNVSKDTGQF